MNCCRYKAMKWNLLQRNHVTVNAGKRSAPGCGKPRLECRDYNHGRIKNSPLFFR